jgi:hypothetical protein
MEDDRARSLLLQCLVDVPNQLLALWLVGLARLPVELILELAIAISSEVAVRLACEAFIKLLIGACWSNMTRLLKTPISGPCEVSVASSRIDMVGGLSGLYILRMPPRFWANAVPLLEIAISNATVAAAARRLNAIFCPRCFIRYIPVIASAMKQ